MIVCMVLITAIAISLIFRYPQLLSEIVDVVDDEQAVTVQLVRFDDEEWGEYMTPAPYVTPLPPTATPLPRRFYTSPRLNEPYD